MPSNTTRTNQPLAVFTRNHQELLKRAEHESANSSYPPHCLFRSNVRWVAAKDALKDQCCVKVYIAPTDADGKNEGKTEVRYVAKLFDVILDPSESTILELKSAYPKLWEAPWTGPAAQTVYLLSNCNKLPSGIPVTKLLKLDGTAISPDYKYSYSLVREMNISEKV